jgi:hypothetical protein
METRMSNRTGILLAEAMQTNSPLRRFVLDCSDTNMDSEVGTALARSVEISSVRDFELWSIGATVGTASAWADAVATSTSLQSFKFVCSEADAGLAQGTTLAMKTALESNRVLQCLRSLATMAAKMLWCLHRSPQTSFGSLALRCSLCAASSL